MQNSTRTKDRFSESARAAALAARRAKAQLPKGDGLEVFAVRNVDTDRTFDWEIRRFGAVVLKRGEGTFDTYGAALEMGRSVLESDRTAALAQVE